MNGRALFQKSLQTRKKPPPINGVAFKDEVVADVRVSFVMTHERIADIESALADDPSTTCRHMGVVTYGLADDT